MLSYVIWYVFIGVFFNFLYDGLISYLNTEELRFTFRERVAVTVFWPLYALLLVWFFLTSFFK
jgi:hypothetical protein